MLGPVPMTMTETFVDLTYRGLSLGRRIKLSQIRPTTGYLEHPTPMPVGTMVSVATDDAVVLDAIVTKVHEQVAGSDTAPGMLIRPTFANDQIEAWWKSRATAEPVAAPAPAPEPERGKPITVRPRTHTVPEPIPTPGPAGTLAAMGTGTVSPAGMAVPSAPTTIPGTVFNPATSIEQPMATIPGTVFNPTDPRATTIMNAVDQDLLASLTKNDEIEQPMRTTGEHAVVDDGMRTTVMDAVDPAALGIDMSMFSGSSNDGIPLSDDENGDDEPSAADSSPAIAGEDKKPKLGGSKKRKKRR
jgi:hypothetical protein